MAPLEPALDSEPPADDRPWGLAHRLGFRFLFAYLVLYAAPWPLGLVPGTSWLARQYGRVWDWLVPLVGRHVLGIERDIVGGPNGSGDRTYDYVAVFCAAALAGLITLVWSALDRRRPHYRRIAGWLRVYLRYVLGWIMLSYGFAKVFKTQFPFPSPVDLLQPYGQSSPMGLLWNFMGYSAPYTIFTGLAEVAGGLLLFARRTTTLGALVLVGVLVNIVLLNFSYDVPVKLYSSHLLLIAIVLVAPDLARLTRVLVLNRAAPPADLGRRPRARRWRRAGVALKVAVLGFTLYSTLEQEIETFRKWGPGSPRGPLYGIYEVEEMTINGEPRPPLLTDPLRWRRAAFSDWGFTAFTMDDRSRWYGMKYDAERGVVELTLWRSEQGSERVFELEVTRPDPEHLVLRGELELAVIEVRMRAVDMSQLPLLRRGFRWINEYPYNR